MNRINLIASAALFVTVSIIPNPALSARQRPAGPYEIGLHSRRFTPDPGLSREAGKALSEQSRKLAQDGRNRIHTLIQLNQIPTREERRRLERQGIKLLTYIPDRAWLASIPMSRSAEVSADRSVRWLGNLQTADKLSAGIRKNSLGRWSYDSSSGRAVILVRLFADVDLSDGEEIVASTGGEVLDRADVINTLVVKIAANRISDLADEDIVEWIEQPLPPLKETNAENRERVGADTLQNPPYDLDGTGVDVLVYDGGVVFSHPDLDSRRLWGDSDWPSVHATHVAGTICGDGTVDSRYRGMAPAANLLSMGFEHDDSGVFLYTNPGDLEDDLYYARVEWEQSADLFNASIGTNTAWNNFPCSYEGNYGLTSLLLDAIVRGELGKPFIAAWAAGNERGGPCGSSYYTTAPPATAKNPIQSGATEAGDDSMSSFSSWGPTDDGRLKLVVCAPGVAVTSCNAYDSYAEKSGTSMASPTTAGVIALMLQQYRDTYFAGSTDVEFLPSSAKALLIHTAEDLGNPGPDFQFGYGRIDGQTAVDAIIAGQMGEFCFGAQSEIHDYTVAVVEGTSELKASLAWDDPPGSLAAVTKLVNDLDLELISPDTTVYYPWILDPGVPEDVAVPGVDRLNNQEQVLIENPAAGDWTVRVIASTLPESPQTYSLVFPGAGSVATTPTPVPASSPPPTPTPGYCFESLDNGDFESGDSAWENYGSFAVSTDYAYSGTQAARLGGTEDGYFYQEITIPDEALSARLSCAVRMETDDTSYRDFFDLEIRDGIGGILTTLLSLCNTDADYESVWTDENFWLPADYAGQTIRVQFRANGDNRDDTFWYVDDVSLEFCYLEGVPTPIPVPSAFPTPSPLPESLPFTEDFEGAWSNGAPVGWQSEYVSGLNQWVPSVSGANGHPSAAHGGSYLAFFFERYGGETRLISPPLDLGSGLATPRLAFWHAQAEWYGNIDTLTVLYRPSAGGTWTDLTTYETSVSGWTKRVLDLPNPSADYYLAFQARGNLGFGVCIDDIFVFSGTTPTPTVTPAPTATPAGFLAPTPTPNYLVCALDLEYSTYLGGSSTAIAMGIVADDSGSAYVTGYSLADDFPTVDPYQAEREGSYDIFIAKMSSSGSTLTFSTYLGGSTYDYGYGIAVDGEGCAHIVGKTESEDFPTANPYQPALASNYDGFVTKLDSSGSELVYSTFLGGTYDDAAYGLDIDSGGCLYVTGLVDSYNFPTLNPYQASKAGYADDIFVTRFSSSGSSLIFSTFLGGSNDDYALGLALNPSGTICLGGVTDSYDFPIEDSYQEEFGGGSSDAFVSALSSTGSSLVFSTYLGGEYGDGCNRIACAQDGGIFVGGYTASDAFPTADAYQPSFGGGDVDAFVSKFSSTGSTVIYSTYLGGDDQDVAYGIAVGSGDILYITRYTQSDDFPTRHPYQSSRNSNALDAYLTGFDAEDGSLVFSSFWGGSENDAAHVVSLDSDSRIYLAGKTASSDFPTSNPYQPGSGGASTSSFVSSFRWRYYFTGPTASPTASPTPTSTATLTPFPTSTATPDGTPRPSPSPSATPAPIPSSTVTTAPSPIPTAPFVLGSGDYDGDGTDDIAIFRENTGLWALRGISRAYFGGTGDMPASGDYDGDGTVEIGIFRPAISLWAIRGLTRDYFGHSTDIVVPGDFTGDGVSVPAIFRPSIGLWAIRGETRTYFGMSDDRPIPGDYYGDGTREIGIFRGSSGLWAIRYLTRLYFGASSDTAVPGDYDGNGFWEVGIFRPTTGLWAIRGITRIYYGASSDQPIPADYKGDGTDDISIFRDSSGLWAAKSLTRLYYGTAGDIPVTR